MPYPHVAIISPAMANANNGNWQTARRWAGFLEGQYRVTLAPEWDGAPADVLIALHARRSAASLAVFSAAYPERPTVLVLTGTDLYRDIRSDIDAQHSLEIADRLVLLNEAAPEELPAALRGKATVIFQSAAPSAKESPAPPAATPEVIMIGHLRQEKDPATFMRAAALVKEASCFLHVGGILDPALERLALDTQASETRYRWLGNLPHSQTRALLARSRLMVLTSRMEGGANVIIEAVSDGVPVLASDIPGNRGMLGADYAGYFPVGDATALARLIDRSLSDHAFLDLLRRQCSLRAPLFAPAREKAALLHLLDNVRSLPGT